MEAFFDRIERKFIFEGIDSQDKLNILDTLLPSSYFVPYASLPPEEQYELYKKRALFKAQCTPIDVLFKAANLNTFGYQDSFHYIFDQMKDMFTKCVEAFPKVDVVIISTWLLFLKGIPKGIRVQMANECRPESLEELQSSIQKFVSNRNRTIGSYFSDLKKSTEPTTSNSSGNKQSKDTAGKRNERSATSQNDSTSPTICSHCSKPGHSVSACWSKHPNLKPTNVHNIQTSSECYSKGVTFILSGSLNNMLADDILFDTGAGITAFHSRFCNGSKTGEFRIISTMSENISIGTYPLVRIPVKTTTFDGLVEGITVDDLKHDAILPALDQDDGTKIVLDLKTSKVDILRPSSKLHELRPSELSSNELLQELHADGASSELSKDESSHQRLASESSSIALLPVEGSLSMDEYLPDLILIDVFPFTDDYFNNSPINNTSLLVNHNNVNLNEFDFKNLLPKSLSIQHVHSLQKSDVFCRETFQKLKNDRFFITPQVELVIHNDLICKLNTGSTYPLSILAPKSLIPLLLKMYHDDSGHPCYTTVLGNINDKFYWQNMGKQIQDYVNKCTICQFDTTNRFHKPVPSDLIELTTEPLEHVCIDFITHFQTSHSGYTYLFTIVDVGTRFANAIPVKTLTAEEFLVQFINHHIYKYGYPKKITSDNGRQFTGKLFTSFCKDQNIDFIRTSPRHPNSNGICERFNGTISDMIKHSCYDDPRSWDEYIQKFLFYYNNLVRNGTKF